MNKKQERGVVKYLVRWKGFAAENNSWEREENLKNAKELVEKFEGKMEVRKQEKLELAEKKDFRRAELPRRYIAKLLYRWKDGKFESEYLKKLKRNWVQWKEKDKKTEKIIIWEEEKDELSSSSRSRNLEEGVISDIQSLDASFFI